MQFQTCTLYTTSGFGNFVAVECRALEIAFVPYAQHERALQVKFIRKGRRKVEGFVCTFEPKQVVVEGHGQFKPDGLFGPSEETVAGVTVQKSRYAACDEGFERDFRAQLEASGARVLFDAREAA